MYFIAKLAQAAGLGVIAIGFIMNYPKLMNIKVFSAGLAVFGFGWIVQRFLLKK